MAEILEVGKLRIGTEVDHSGLKKADAHLQRDSESIGKRAGDSFKKGISAGITGLALILTSKVGGALKGVKGIVTRGLTGVFDFTALGLLSVSRSVRQLTATIAESNSQFAGLAKVMNVVATAGEKTAEIFFRVSAAMNGAKIATAALTAAVVVAANKAAAEFIPSWNRVRTLLGDSPNDFRELRMEVLAVAGAAGVEAPEAFAALYEILSAMPQLADEPTRALNILATSLDVATTGFGTSAEAASALTGIINAFGLEAEDARRVSDALFAAQDQGVTTFGEIAASIGTVGDLASSLGGRFEDLLGILATTTDTGVSTSQRFTQLRSVISAIVKPTAQAEEALEGLNIDLGAASLESEGLVGFLLQLIDVTGGNPDVLAQVFPQESLSLVLALARQTDVLTEKTRNIAEESGQTSDKVAVMNEQWGRQVDLLKGRVMPTLEELGFQMQRLATKELEAFNGMLDVIAGNLNAIADAKSGLDLDALIRDARAGGAFAPDEQTVPGVEVRTTRQSLRARPPEPTSIEHSRAKIRELNEALEANAIVQLAATGNAEEYKASIRDAQEQVNELVLAEMDRLRAAGVSEKEIRKLAAAYNVLSDEIEREDRALSAAQSRLEATAVTTDRLREQTERWGLSVGALPGSVTTAVAELGRLEQEMEALREDIELVQAAGNPIPTGAADALAQMEARAAELRAELQRTIPTITDVGEGLVAIAGPQMVDQWIQIGESIVPVKRALTSLAEANTRVTAAERELRQARRTQDADRIAEAEQKLAAARNEVVRQTSAFAKAIEESNLPLKVQEELLAKIDEVLRAAGIELEDFGVEMSKFGEYATMVSTLVRGLVSVADAAGLIGNEARRAIQGLDGIIQGLQAIEKAKGAEGLQQILGFATGGVAALGGIMSLGASVLASAGMDERREEERQQVLRELTDALREASKRIEELGANLTRMRPDQVGTIRATADFFASPDRNTLPSGLTPADIRRSAEEFGFTLPDILIGPGGITQDLADEIAEVMELALAAAKEQVQADFVPDLEAREASLAGDDVEAQRIRAAAAAAKEKQAAEELHAAGFITLEQLERLKVVLGEELAEAIEEAERAAEKAAEAEQRRARAFEADLLVREAALSGEGGTEALRARMEADAAAELAAAEELLEAGTITQEMFDRLAAVLEGEIVDAIEAVEEAARRAARAFETDLLVREARLADDTEGEIRARHDARATAELAAAQELLDAGTITEDQLLRLAEILDRELADALDRAARAAEEASRQFDENVEVRELEAKGRHDEAKIRRQELEHEEQLRAAREAGRSEDQIAALLRVQDLEMRALLKALADAAAEEDSPLAERSRRRDVNEVTRRDVTGITTVQAVGMLGVMELQLHAERQQVAHLAGILSVLKGNPVSLPSVPGMSSVGMASVQAPPGGGGDVHINGPLIGHVTLADGGPAEATRLADNLDAALGDRLRRPLVTRSSGLR